MLIWDPFLVSPSAIGCQCLCALFLYGFQTLLYLELKEYIVGNQRFGDDSLHSISYDRIESWLIQQIETQLGLDVNDINVNEPLISMVCRHEIS